MHGQGTAGTWGGRLLLLAALLLGIVTMHTLGHPTEHGHPTDHGRPTAPAAHTAHSSPHAVTAPVTEHLTPPPRPGMDPMSVCLAVLGAGWTVVLLLALAALRRPSGTAGAAPRAWHVHALWPVPPPPRHKALARLSVLRV
ncbi:hypothetical protein [Streptomyces sp. I05A-00742]|uniref:hypothetical protein n=1 Tax=Streptomyces sp. I05A-00742 TaxID=2732853 RepID=UPI001488E414|nr:hypothetical protein [Streptomyces sp. I05A-00742]